MPERSFSSAAITGAAGGIGRALARQLAEEGTRVHLADIDEKGLAVTAAEAPGASSYVADVADHRDMDRFAAAVGEVDLVCLNAGVVSSEAGPPWTASPEEWDRVLGVNLTGVVNGLRSFVPGLLERGRPAHVLVTASLAGAATWPGGGPYSASKHAVLAVAEQAALHLAESAVGVTVLCPALVRSGMSESGEDPLDVARRALAAVRSGTFAVIPQEWRSAVTDRAAILTSGRQPSAPIPTPDA